MISKEKQATTKSAFAFLDIISEKTESNQRLQNQAMKIYSEVKDMDDLIKGVKIGKLLSKDDKKETKKIIAIIIGAIAGIAAIAGTVYGIYKFVNRDYYDDFEDDFDDLFEEDESDFEEE